MAVRTGVIGLGLLLSLLVVPPLPGYLIAPLAGGAIPMASDETLWQTVVDPLRLLGSLMALAWVWAMTGQRASANPRLLYPVTFLGTGILYAIPAWAGLGGADPPWQAAWWLLSIATVSEWLHLHAPVAGLLGLLALRLLRGHPAPEPQGRIAQIMGRIGLRAKP